MKRSGKGERSVGSDDHMLLLLLESSDPSAGELARRLLSGLGFQVEIAKSEMSGALDLDYKKARFAVVAVADGRSEGQNSVGEWSGGEPRGNLFAGVFLGVDPPKGLKHATYIEPDERGVWTDQLVETLRLLGWLPPPDVGDTGD